jgi:hypothetical protein
MEKGGQTMPILYKNREPLVVGVSIVNPGIRGTKKNGGGGFAFAIIVFVGIAVVVTMETF